MKLPVLAALAVAGAGAAALGYARFIEPGRLEVRSLDLALRGLAPAFDGFRILHLSDLHAGASMPERRMGEIAARARAIQPDLIAFTGDFVTGSANYDAVALGTLLNALSAPDGVFAVLGNHDHVGHSHVLRQVLRASGVTELENQVHTLHRDGVALHIAGVDSLYHRKARLDAVLAALPNDAAPAILLAHEPDIADVVAPSGRIALQLSGHAHGGQVALPGGLTALGLPEHGRRYIDGLYLVEKMFVYANRGLGMTSAPLRFNSRPEITVITLRAPAGSTPAAAPAPKRRSRRKSDSNPAPEA